MRLSPEQMSGVLELLADVQTADDDRKEKQRNRTRRFREKHIEINEEQTSETECNRYGNDDVTLHDRYPSPQTPYPVISTLGVSRSSKEKTPKGVQKKGSERGSRLSEDWSLPDEWRDWAKGEYPALTDSEITRRAVEFRDYWISVSGAKATKRDWFATFRNWIRMVASRPAARTEFGKAPPAPILTASEQTVKCREYWATFGIDRATEADPSRREDWKDLLTVWFEHEIWPGKTPNPKHPQCAIPKEMVQAFADKYGWEAPRYRKAESVAA
jgi:hypothetical protein